LIVTSLYVYTSGKERVKKKSNSNCHVVGLPRYVLQNLTNLELKYESTTVANCDGGRQENVERTV